MKKLLFLLVLAIVMPMTMQAADFGIWIDGKEMFVNDEFNTSNYPEVIKSGKITLTKNYNGTKNLLTLDNVTIESKSNASDEDVIFIWGVGDFDFIIKGKCIINNKNANRVGISLKYPASSSYSTGSLRAFVTHTTPMSDTDELVINSENGGIYIDGEDKEATSFNLYEAKMTINAKNYGIKGRRGIERFGVYAYNVNSFLDIKPSKDGAAFGFRYIQIDHPTLYPKEGMTYDGGTAKYNGSIYKGRLVIGPMIETVTYDNSTLFIPKMAIGAPAVYYKEFSLSPRNTWNEFDWVVSDPQIVKVEHYPTSGVPYRIFITPLKVGGCTITGIPKDGSGKIISFKVEVGQYPVWVAGIRVTDDNASNITGPGITGGNVSYNRATNTLTLNGATITGTSYSSTDNNNEAIRTDQHNLNIQVIGNCSVKAGTNSDDPAISVSGDLKIYSDGTGKLTATNSYLYASTIRATKKYAEGSPTQNLKIEYVDLTAINTKNGGTIQALQGNLILNNCYIEQPYNAVIQNGEIRVNGILVYDKVVIKPGVAPVTYPLWIVGFHVNENNASDITGNGTASYNDSTKTLTLNNLNLFAGKGSTGIRSEIEGLTIKLNGTNVISSENRPTIVLSKNTTIIGDSSTLLYAVAKSEYVAQTAINCGNSTLTISGGCTVVADSPTYGIGDLEGSSQSILKVNGSTFKAKGVLNGSIRDFRNIELTGAAFTAPEDAEFNPAVKGVADASGNLLKDWVIIEPVTGTDFYNVILESVGADKLAVIKVIRDFLGVGLKEAKELVDSVPVILARELDNQKAEEFKTSLEQAGATVLLSSYTLETYPLWVAGTQVKKKYIADIKGRGIMGLPGAVSYNPDTKTLTLKKVTINVDDNNGINNQGIEDLKIELIGNNTISNTANSKSAIELLKNTAISGAGTLTVNAKYVSIRLESCNLNIEGGCTVIANSENWGISGIGTTEVLTVKNSIVKATGTAQYSIGAFKDLILEGCRIVEPAGAIFTHKMIGIEDIGAVYDGDNIVKTEVVINLTTDVENTGISEFTLYPNPTRGTLYINGLQQPATVRVYNSMGEVVHTQQVIQNQALELGYLPKGIYVVHINNITKKIVLK